MDHEAKRILDRRLAAGNITKEQYLETLELLQGELRSQLSKSGRDYDETQKHTSDEVILRVNGTLSLCSPFMLYKGREIGYEKVLALSYYAWRTSVNFIPISSATELTIFLMDDENIVLQWGHLFRYPWTTPGRTRRAYSYLSERTFRQRVNRYLAKMNSTGKVDLGGSPSTHLYADGTLVQGDIKLNLKEEASSGCLHFGTVGILSSDPYEITAGGGWPRKKIKFSAFVDHDVVIALLHHFSSVEANQS